MGNHIVYITVICRICQRNSRNYRSSEAQSSQIGKINHGPADGASDAAAYKRILKTHIHAEKSRLRNSEKNRDKAGNAKLLGLGISPVLHQISQNGTALGRHGYGHKRVQNIPPRIRQKLCLNGAENMVKPRDNNQLLQTGEKGIAEYAQILGHPHQSPGNDRCQPPAQRPDGRKEQKSSHQGCEKGGYQQANDLGNLFLKEEVQLCRYHAHQEGYDNAALKSHQIHAQAKQVQGSHLHGSLGRRIVVCQTG